MVDRMPCSTELVWYVSYGSNMAASRLRYYLTGGTPPGGRRAHPGARDPRRPRAARGITIPGEVYFARRSTLWGGGIAFFDPSAPGVTAARAYLVSRGQFSDIAGQEMQRSPDRNLD